MNAQEIIHWICMAANILSKDVCPIVDQPPAGKIITNESGHQFKLGRRRPLAHGPRLKFGDFLKADAQPAPPQFGDYIKSGSAPIYAASEDILGNDRYGDCTCAGAGHILNILRANSEAAGAWREATRNDALAFYSRVTNPPFIPVLGLNDNGADEQTVLNVWQKSGFYSDGTGKIEAWASVDGTKPEEVRQAMWLFGNLYFGVELPDAWINPMPSKSGFTWDVAGDPDQNNGHCYIGYGYNDKGVFIDTWGEFGTMTWEAIAKYCASGVGELYTVLAPDWINQVTQKSPSGFDSAQLESYIKTLFS